MLCHDLFSFGHILLDVLCHDVFTLSAERVPMWPFFGCSVWFLWAWCIVWFVDCENSVGFGVVKLV